jgi:DUF4097 and DUF4098 domain-containing protein YvlB
MKKPFIITLFIIAAFVVLGVVILLASVGFNFKLAFGHEDRTLKTWTAKDSITSVKIDVSDDDIIFAPSDDGSFRVEYYEGDRHTYTISDEDGAFVLAAKNFQFAFWSFGDDYSVTVYMPKEDLDRLDLDVSSGKVYLDADIHIENAVINTSSGNITLGSITAKDVTLGVSSGNVSVSGVNSDNLEIEASSGDITLTDSTVNQLFTNLSSGNTTLTDCTVQSYEADASSGKITATGLSLGTADLNVSSGDVRLALKSADPSDYKMILDTSSGNISVKGGGYDLDTEDSATLGSGGQEIHIDVSSGDIGIDFGE